MPALYARVMIQVSERFLFVCSANYIRSPTAEYVARQRKLLASSCGTNRFPDFSVVPISHQIVEWADIIICMEAEHVRKVNQHPAAAKKVLYCWNLPDDWREPYDPQLVRIITHKLEETLQLRRVTEIEARLRSQGH
jgi:predicted protein tyrosine phosphatase